MSVSRTYLQNGHDQAKQADDAGKDFRDENLYKEAFLLRIGSVSESGTGAEDSYTDAARQVTQTDSQPSSKHGIT